MQKTGTASGLMTGQKARDFKLPNALGQNIVYDELAKGLVILIFYPGGFARILVKCLNEANRTWQTRYTRIVHKNKRLLARLKTSQTFDIKATCGFRATTLVFDSLVSFNLVIILRSLH
ncbi:hypothetical protein [Paenibacillus sp. R14(2021)]|uniref:hypothetical protein n=1 Tax=Paenibacillus sp. R14(2021) TaxID=2859228 RepID=UPI001C6143FF|nr:hypothetical protein [Paenibacillus sp. R14(2021)]